MRNATIIASLAVVALIAGGAGAATITREALDADGSNVDTSGTTVFAWNLNGGTDVTFKGITWDTDQPTKVYKVTSYGQTPGVESDRADVEAAYTDSNLAAMMGDYRYGGWQGAASPSIAFFIDGLTQGQEYRLQFLTDYARTSANSTAYRLLDEDNDLLTSYATGVQELVTFDFIGDSDGEMLVQARAQSSRGAVSGMLLQEVPEPATMGLLAVGGLALLRRRSRKA